MANIKSARKRARQALVRRDHNMALRTRVRSAMLWSRRPSAWRARLRADLMLAMNSLRP